MPAAPQQQAQAVRRSATREIFKESLIQLAWVGSHKPTAGLVNLGNTCFMNSVLQCLANTAPLAQLFLADHDYSKAVGDAIEITQQYIKRAFTGSNIMKPVGHHKILKQLNKRFRLGRQEDAHEFLRCLVDAMHEVSLKGMSPKPSPDLCATTLIHRVFGGRLRSQVRCDGVDYQSNTFDPFLDLSLEINRASSLTRALQLFTAAEVLDGANKYRCPKNNKLVKAHKQITIDEAPNVLTVHLKRFEFGMYGSKINKKVEYDLQLDLKPYMHDAHGIPHVYDLYGVLVHHGHSVNSGHYLCYVKASSGTWLVCDDSRVAIVSEKMILSQHAYMLFYVRRTSRIPSTAAAAASSLVRSAALSAQQRTQNQQEAAGKVKAANGSSNGVPTVANHAQASKAVPTVANQSKDSKPSKVAVTTTAATQEVSASEPQPPGLPAAKRRKLLVGEVNVAVPAKEHTVKPSHKKKVALAASAPPLLASGTPASLPLLNSIKVPSLKLSAASAAAVLTAAGSSPVANGQVTSHSQQVASASGNGLRSPIAAGAAKLVGAPASVYEYPVDSPRKAAAHETAAAADGGSGAVPTSPVPSHYRKQQGAEGIMSPIRSPSPLMRSPRPVLTRQQRSKQRAAGDNSMRQPGGKQPYQNPTSSPLAFLATCQQVVGSKTFLKRRASHSLKPAGSSLSPPPEPHTTTGAAAATAAAAASQQPRQLSSDMEQSMERVGKTDHPASATHYSLNGHASSPDKQQHKSSQSSHNHQPHAEKLSGGSPPAQQQQQQQQQGSTAAELPNGHAHAGQAVVDGAAATVKAKKKARKEARATAARQEGALEEPTQTAHILNGNAHAHHTHKEAAVPSVPVVAASSPIPAAIPVAVKAQPSPAPAPSIQKALKADVAQVLFTGAASTAWLMHGDGSASAAAANGGGSSSYGATGGGFYGNGSNGYGHVGAGPGARLGVGGVQRVTPWDDGVAEGALASAVALRRAAAPAARKRDEYEEEYDTGKTKKQRGEGKAGSDLHKDGNMFQRASEEGWRGDHGRSSPRESSGGSRGRGRGGRDGGSRGRGRGRSSDGGGRGRSSDRGGRGRSGDRGGRGRGGDRGGRGGGGERGGRGMSRGGRGTPPTRGGMGMPAGWGASPGRGRGPSPNGPRGGFGRH